MYWQGSGSDWVTGIIDKQNLLKRYGKEVDKKTKVKLTPLWRVRKLTDFRADWHRILQTYLCGEKETRVGRVVLECVNDMLSLCCAYNGAINTKNLVTLPWNGFNIY